jgi:hypothetical protein
MYEIVYSRRSARFPAFDMSDGAGGSKRSLQLESDEVQEVAPPPKLAKSEPPPPLNPSADVAATCAWLELALPDEVSCPLPALLCLSAPPCLHPLPALTVTALRLLALAVQAGKAFAATAKEQGVDAAALLRYRCVRAGGAVRAERRIQLAELRARSHTGHASQSGRSRKAGGEQ